MTLRFRLTLLCMSTLLLGLVLRDDQLVVDLVVANPALELKLRSGAAGDQGYTHLIA